MAGRILLIADAGSFWIKRFLQHVLVPAGWEAVLFPIWDGPGRYEAYYRQTGVTVYSDKHTLPLVRHIPRVRMWARVALNARDLRRLGPFDAIHNLYPSRRDLALGLAVKRACPGARWVCSFMGSDLLRASEAEKRRMAAYLRRCDRVTIHPNNRTEIIAAYGDSVSRKTVFLDFGQAACRYIDALRESDGRVGCKQRLGIDPTKTVLCVGGSAASEQRHIDVVRALRALPEALQRRLALVFSMTYGERKPGYVDSVRHESEALSCQSVFLTKFMEEDEAAVVRLAADGYLSALPTDSFSSTLEEYLYAGAQILLGDWLSYPLLNEMGIAVSRFSDFSNIPAFLENLINNTLPPVDMQKRHPVGRDTAWDVVAPEWRALYE